MMENNKPTRLDLRAAFDLATPLPDLDFVLPGLLAGTVGMIAAPGGTGKTFWMLQTAISIASYTQRIPFFGGVWEPSEYSGRVVLLLAEDPLEILTHRVRAISKWLSSGYDIPQLIEDLEGSLEVHSLIGYQPCLIDYDGKANEAWIQMVKKTADGTRLLCIDPLRRWHRGNEIDNGVMTYLIQILEEIARGTGCTILFSHHVNKLSMLMGTGGDQTAARGASALSDGVRWQLNMRKMSKEEAMQVGVNEHMRGQFVQMEISKSNYGITNEPVWLRREEGGVLVKAVFPMIIRKDKKEMKYEKEIGERPA